jgi:hypothetical protein
LLPVLNYSLMVVERKSEIHRSLITRKLNERSPRFYGVG